MKPRLPMMNELLAFWHALLLLRVLAEFMETSVLCLNVKHVILQVSQSNMSRNLGSNGAGIAVQQVTSVTMYNVSIAVRY